MVKIPYSSDPEEADDSNEVGSSAQMTGLVGWVNLTHPTRPFSKRHLCGLTYDFIVIRFTLGLISQALQGPN